MDVTKAIAPRSDQLNFEDFVPSGPDGARTFTIADVRAGTTEEQPIRVYLAEGPEGRPWTPSKSMSRVMSNAWGKESDNWIGKRVTLYGDPDVMFGPMKMGGIRISHLSGIGRRKLTVNLSTTRGRRAPWSVEPLSDDAPAPAKVPGPLDQLVWAFNAAKIEQADRLPYCCGVIGREVADPRAMTADEMGKVVEVLRKQTPAPSGEPSEEEQEAAFVAEQERNSRG